MNTQNQIKRIEELRSKLPNLHPLNSEEVKRFLEQFAIRNTYNSIAIKGSNLTLNETAMILQEGVTISEHPLKEHLEVIGHKYAFDYVVEFSQKNKPLELYDIRMIHLLVLMNDRVNAGIFRRVPLMIMETSHTPPQPYEIKPMMESMIDEYNNSDESFFDKLAKFHLDFERIHPFIDGNGRTGRLILNLELLKGGYCPVDIRCSDKMRYYNAFEDYNNSHNSETMKTLILEYELSELEDYVTVVEQARNMQPLI